MYLVKLLRGTLHNFARNIYRLCVTSHIAFFMQNLRVFICVTRNYSECFGEVGETPRFGVKSFLVLLHELYCIVLNAVKTKNYLCTIPTFFIIQITR